VTQSGSHPGGSDDDKRTATGLVVSLTTYVTTAAVAVLGAQGVIVTFVLDRRTSLFWFKSVSIVATVMLVVSILLRGRGAFELIQAGARGDWRVKTRRGLFNWQALLTLAGATLVVVSAFLGTPKPATP
jgi:hypothetical protein